jgi:hypothetical protein
MSYREFLREIEIWRKQRLRPLAFFRDDDAVAVTPRLRRLVGVCERHEVSIILSTIPAYADSSLGAFVRASPLLVGAVHGYSHANFSSDPARKSEFCGDRNLQLMLQELELALFRCEEIFEESLSYLFVAPWHQIDSNLLDHLIKTGYSGVSRFGWNDHFSREVNVHVDFIDWGSGHRFQTWDELLQDITWNLRMARLRSKYYFGLVTHHDVFDNSQFHLFEEIVRFLKNEGIDLVSADSLLHRKSNEPTS